MSIKTFNTLASEDWTVPAGMAVAYFDLTSPGQDGFDPDPDRGGFGGIGGEFHHIGADGTAAAAALAGETIRVTRNADFTEILNVTQSKVVYRYGFVDGDFSDYGFGAHQTVATERSAGSGDETFGGGGAAGQTAANDATDGAVHLGGTGSGGHQGGNGGDINGDPNGQDGTTFGDGGGGGAIGGVGGHGKLGFAAIGYEVASMGTAPTITSNSGGTTASVSIAENTTVATIVTADGDATIAFSITGGADQAKFTINSSTGVLRFASPPDYETPTDANTDNAYIVEVTATNDSGTDAQTITVTVTNDAAEGTHDYVNNITTAGSFGFGF